MTKDDYMKLPKERLAELLAERDNIVPPPPYPNQRQPFCWEEGGVCSNKFHDCINCPRNWSTGGYGLSVEENVVPLTVEGGNI